MEKIDWEYLFVKSSSLGMRMKETRCVLHSKMFLLYQVRIGCEIIVPYWIRDFSLNKESEIF